MDVGRLRDIINLGALLSPFRFPLMDDVSDYVSSPKNDGIVKNPLIC